jgi:hypothetical protein
MHNITKHAKLPFSNTVIKPHNRTILTGSGMGSVLLRPGGGGGASSYMDLDDYIKTTGNNPYAKAKHSTGYGLPKTLSSKLQNLNVVPEKSKRKNIVMSM